MFTTRTLLAVVTACLLALPAAGQTSSPAAAPGHKEALLLDFEKDSKKTCEGMDKLEYVAEHATEGKASGKTALKGDGVTLFLMITANQNEGGKWGEYDRFVMDVFVEGGNVKVSGLIRDDKGTTWGERYNFDFEIQPGKRQVEIPIGSIIRESDHKPMNIDKLTNMAIGFTSADPAKPATVYMDNARLVKGSEPFTVKSVFSFENETEGKLTLEDWPEEFKGKSEMKVVAEHATDGKKALRLDSRAPAGNVQFAPAFQEWAGFDTLAIDVFNPSDKPVDIGGWIKAKPTDAYLARCNWNRMIRPGQSTIKLPLGGLTNGADKPFNTSHVEVFNLSTDNATLFIDNIRLIKGVEEVPVEGIKKFDFGPAASAVMPGFTPVSKDSGYSKAKGFGWLPGGTFNRDYDIREVMNRHIAPDSLYRDACMPNKATFAVDVPNGDYRAWVVMGPPGGFLWIHTLRHRTVSVQDKVVDELKFDAESFKKVEFAWEDTEDLPGDDLWQRYIEAAYKPILVDVAVTDGQIKIAFDAFDEPFTAEVCAAVIWPKAQEKEAQKWLANLANARKEQFDATHVEKPPAAPAPLKATDADTAKGFARFIHSSDRDIYPSSVPTAAELATAALVMFAAPGQYEAGCIGLYPFKDAGAVKISVGDLTGPEGKKLPASAVEVQVSRYKAICHGATYTVEPRYLDAMPKDGLALKTGITRSIWVTVHVPADAAAGEYKGQVTISAGDKTDSVPMTLTVWPIKLSDPQLPMGMFNVAPPYYYLNMETGKEGFWKEWKNILEDSRAHGMTSMDPGICMPLTAVKDGKAVIDFTNMDKWMEMAKAAGFKGELHNYCGGPGFSLRPQATENGQQGEAARFGLKTYAEMIKLYFDAYKEHAKEKGYLPMNFCIDDEYLVHGGTPEHMAKFGQMLKDNAPGISFVPVDSMYPDERPKEIPALDAMLKCLDTWGAGLHSPKQAEMVKAAGARLWLYNTGMDRFTFGTYMFFASKKWDVKGFTQWTYGGDGSLSHYDKCGFIEASYGVVEPSSRGMRPTITWERIRTGCNDHKYLETAWEQIAAAKAAGKGVEEAKALEAVIEGTFAKMTFGKVGGVDAASGEGKADNPMNPAQMDKFRQQVAEGIVKLQAASK